MTPNNKKDVVSDADILSVLKENWDLGKQYYYRDHRKMRMLDMTDRGERWKAIGAEFPPYQILPDTNNVSYVKDNILASLYTTAKSADILPTSEDDAELCTKLSITLAHIWDIEDIGFKQFQAGERAALLNIGITQVGWDEDFIKGDEEKRTLQKGRILLKNINPIQFMRDPFAENLEESAWCCTYNRLHKSIIKNDPKYSDAFKAYLSKGNTDGSSELLPSNATYHELSVNKDHYNVVCWWLRNKNGGIDEIHTIDTDVILFKRENIKPSCFPFAILYCNSPSTGLVGTSGPAKIYANDTAYNLMNSLQLTAEYKNQRPPKFVSASSGLNIPAFTKHGAEADRTFIVNGDASNAVHYHQFPNVSPGLKDAMLSLQNDIQNVSGVDGRYTGRDTGSIITTGGTEEMLNRVTMIDTPKIVNYEKYAKSLTELILLYLLQFSPKRSYFIRNKMTREYDTVEVDFPKIDKKTIFQYAISISSDLPKNKQRIAAWANMIMEKQMQYRQNGGNVELLTEEEWLQMQDIPNKEQMLERMGFERDTNAIEETSQILYQYSKLVEQGMTPEDAMLIAANTLQNTRKGVPLNQAETQLTQDFGSMATQATPTAMPSPDILPV